MKTLTINLNPKQLSPLNVFSQNAVAKYDVMFFVRKRVKKARFLSFFKLLVFFSFVCYKSQTTADDVIISQ